MAIKIMLGDVREQLRLLPDDSVDIVITSPPYWGLRSYLPADHADKHLEMGSERTLGEHIETMVDVFREMRRVMKPDAPFWLNYGDCYAAAPNGRSAADTKAAGNDDRTFRDKPFSTVGPIYPPDPGNPFPDVKRRGGGNAPSGPIYDTEYRKGRRPRSLRKEVDKNHTDHGRIVAGGYLKPKDLCMIPFRLAIALQSDGWWIRSRCMWGKPNGMPDSSGKYRPSVAHEEVFLLSKSGRLFYDAEAVKAPASEKTNSRVKMPDNWDTAPGSHGSHHRNGREKGKTLDRAPGVTPKSAPEGTNIRAKQSFHASTTEVLDTRYLRTYEPEVWHIATAAYGEAHYATFPPALVERCLMAGTPKDRRCVVLDPFGGAGTVGLVADRMGHDAILIELNEVSTDLARARIKADAGMFSDVA